MTIGLTKSCSFLFVEHFERVASDVAKESEHELLVPLATLAMEHVHEEQHLQGRKRHLDSLNYPTSEGSTSDEEDHVVSSGSTHISTPDLLCSSDKEDESLVIKIKKRRIENMLSDYRCTCCMEVVIMPTMLTPCRHLFCFKCIESWVRTYQNMPPQCPNCKQVIRERVVLPSSLVNALNMVIEVGLPVAEQAERQSISQTRQLCHNRFLIEKARGPYRRFPNIKAL